MVVEEATTGAPGGPVVVESKRSDAKEATRRSSALVVRHPAIAVTTAVSLEVQQQHGGGGGGLAPEPSLPSSSSSSSSSKVVVVERQAAVGSERQRNNKACDHTDAAASNSRQTPNSPAAAAQPIAVATCGGQPTEHVDDQQSGRLGSRLPRRKMLFLFLWDSLLLFVVGVLTAVSALGYWYVLMWAFPQHATAGLYSSSCAHTGFRSQLVSSSSQSTAAVAGSSSAEEEVKGGGGGSGGGNTSDPPLETSCGILLTSYGTFTFAMTTTTLHTLLCLLYVHWKAYPARTLAKLSYIKGTTALTVAVYLLGRYLEFFVIERLVYWGEITYTLYYLLLYNDQPKVSFFHNAVVNGVPSMLAMVVIMFMPELVFYMAEVGVYLLPLLFSVAGWAIQLSLRALVSCPNSDLVNVDTILFKMYAFFQIVRISFGAIIGQDGGSYLKVAAMSAASGALSFIVTFAIHRKRMRTTSAAAGSKRQGLGSAARNHQIVDAASCADGGTRRISQHSFPASSSSSLALHHRKTLAELFQQYDESAVLPLKAGSTEREAAAAATTDKAASPSTGGGGKRNAATVAPDPMTALTTTAASESQVIPVQQQQLKKVSQLCQVDLSMYLWERMAVNIITSDMSSLGMLLVSLIFDRHFSHEFFDMSTCNEAETAWDTATIFPSSLSRLHVSVYDLYLVLIIAGLVWTFTLLLDLVFDMKIVDNWDRNRNGVVLNAAVIAIGYGPYGFSAIMKPWILHSVNRLSRDCSPNGRSTISI